MIEPSATLSPTLTLIATILPASGDGTSIAALSVSSVTRPLSLATTSPTFTRTSITSTSVAPPRSGTLMVWTEATDAEAAAAGAALLPAPDVAGAAGAALLAALGVAAAAGSACFAALVFFAAGSALGTGTASAFAAPPAVSRLMSSTPCFTWAPTLTSTSLTTPLFGDGTSMAALSLSSTTSGSFSLMLSPAFTSTSMTSTASSLPRSGT
jgi:hypothetical protein